MNWHRLTERRRARRDAQELRRALDDAATSPAMRSELIALAAHHQISR
jgi:hypothetical protein